MNALISDRQHKQPWHKQFWPWFLIALPGVVVIASIVTIYIAVSGRDSLVKDDYYKDGLAINAAIDRDKTAARRHIAATLTLDAHNNAALELRGDLRTPPAQLLLQFIHPMRDSADLRIAAAHVGANHYRSQLPHAIDGRWYIEISDPLDSSWRLRQPITVALAQPLSITP